MERKSNFHTHTNFCDGADSIEEIAQEAEKRALFALGFSSHAMKPFSDDWHIAPNRFDDYCAQIKSAAKSHQNIKIRLGFEADFIPGITIPSFKNYEKFAPDFLIGSVHFVYNGRGIFEADDSTLNVQRGIGEFYGGNVRNAVVRYFEQEREMLESGGFSIIGHADVIRRANGKSILFDERDSWYIEQIKLTADKIARSGVCAEINTGGLARKKIDSFYPSEDFLRLLFEKNVPITISSDCHKKSALDFAFDEARVLAKKIGYTESVIDFENGNFVFAPL